MNKTKEISHGLRPLPYDARDVKFGAVFPLGAITDLPEEFTVAEPLEMLDQGMSDTCAGHASVEVSEDEEGVALDPLYQFAKAKQDEGTFETWGADLRMVAKTFIDWGSIEKSLAPFTLLEPREKWADWKNYPASLDTAAAKHKKDSFAFVSGPNDHFDNCRLTMYKAVTELGIKKSIFTGAMWCPEWTPAQGGVVDFVGNPQSGHAVKFFGWKTINGIPYMKVQLSNGTDIGDKGIYYFSRDVVNKCFQDFGNIVFTPLSASKLKTYHSLGIEFGDGFLTKIWKAIQALFGPFTSQSS